MNNQISDQHEKLLNNVYYSPDGTPGSFSSARLLYLEAKRLDKSITFNTVKKYLLQNSSYLSHRRVLRKFERRSFLPIAPHDTWAIDYIVYLKDKGSDNRKVNCLTCLETFSHYGWAKPAASKSAEETLKVFKEIISEAKTVPKHIFLDQGK